MAKGLKFWKKRLPVTALVLAGAFVAGSASYLAVHDAVSPPPDAGEEEFRLTLPAPSGSSVTVPDEGPAEPPPQEGDRPQGSAEGKVGPDRPARRNAVDITQGLEVVIS